MLKSFDDKYSLIIVILSYLFILSHLFIRSVDLFCSISFYVMSFLKFLASKGKIVVNFANEILPKIHPLVGVSWTPSPWSATDNDNKIIIIIMNVDMSYVS